MSHKTRIEYFGWSCFAIDSGHGKLLFDPFFRPMHGANWAKLANFTDARQICVTHGHYEHYLDTPPIVKLTAATVISSKLVCNHLVTKYTVPKEATLPIEPGKPVNVGGFNISAFEWRHRDISFSNFFKGDILTALQFVWYALFRSPFRAPFYGYFITDTSGLSLMNYGEGFSNLMDLGEVEALAALMKPRILLAGMQLNFEKELARGVAAFSPEVVVLYHPHEALFGKFKIVSSKPDEFVASIKRISPSIKVVTVKPPYTELFID